MSSLNDMGQRFADALRAAAQQNDATSAANGNAQKVHVSGAGRTLTFAYEQLRNAAEYTEEHLLLQRATLRFYRRVFLSRDQAVVAQAGDELITELTLAGYLQNDSVTVETVNQINGLAGEYYGGHLKHKKDEWTLQVLAVEIERLLNSDLKRDVFTQFAYDHFATTIDRKKLFGRSDVADFEIALFVGVHRALLKSDPATIRTALLHRYQQRPDSPAFVQTNKMIDGVLESPTADKLYHLVSRRGAALRILWRLIDEHEDVVQLLSSREQFLSAYEAQIQNEYSRINSRINKGIVKSVIFLVITKVLIGVSVEVPYDYLTHGSIVVLPLAINLLFPPIYMVLLRFTLRLPGESNTHTLTDITDQLLYGNERTVGASYRTGKGFGFAFNVAYVVFFILIFGGVALWLVSLGFSLLHLLVFFVFLSTASFLGFRLSRQIRELEAMESQQDGITLIRDFLYIPFVVVGRWISEKYSKINIVAMMLDMVIELPMKTVLHLIRQWGAFIASKKDEL